MKLCAPGPSPSEGLYGDGEEAVAGVAAHAGRYLACFLCSARRAATPEAPWRAARPRVGDDEVRAPTGFLARVGECDVGYQEGVVSGGTCPVLERVLDTELP